MFYRLKENSICYLKEIFLYYAHDISFIHISFNGLFCVPGAWLYLCQESLKERLLFGAGLFV